MLNKSNTQGEVSQAQVDAEAPDHTWRNLSFYLLGSALSVVLVFWPWTLGSRAAWRAPPMVADAGTIRKVAFVGGLLINTQVDTEVRPWLVEGFTRWLPGTQLETREDFFGRQICAVGTDDCRTYR